MKPEFWNQQKQQIMESIRDLNEYGALIEELKALDSGLQDPGELFFARERRAIMKQIAEEPQTITKITRGWQYFAKPLLAMAAVLILALTLQFDFFNRPNGNQREWFATLQALQETGWFEEDQDLPLEELSDQELDKLAYNLAGKIDFSGSTVDEDLDLPDLQDDELDVYIKFLETKVGRGT